MPVLSKEAEKTKPHQDRQYPRKDESLAPARGVNQESRDQCRGRNPHVAEDAVDGQGNPGAFPALNHEGEPDGVIDGRHRSDKGEIYRQLEW